MLGTGPWLAKQTKFRETAMDEKLFGRVRSAVRPAASGGLFPVNMVNDE